MINLIISSVVSAILYILASMYIHYKINKIKQEYEIEVIRSSIYNVMVNLDSVISAIDND